MHWAMEDTFQLRPVGLSQRDSVRAGEVNGSFKIMNIKELVDLLRTKKTIIQGSTVLAYKSVAECDYQSDLMLKTLQNPEMLRTTEIAINSFGTTGYLERVYSDIASARQKYMIDALEERLRSIIGLSDDEIDTLTAFSKVRARSEARIDFVKSLAN
jgi:hypothetical protein